MDDIAEPGGTARDIPAGTVISPAGTVIGVADTGGDPAPPNPAETAAPEEADEGLLSRVPTSPDDVAPFPVGIPAAGEDVPGEPGVDYRRLGESGADES